MKPPQIELPKSLIWIALLILISIVVIGCTPEVVVRDREVKIPVPIYIDTLNGYGNNQDTVYAERIVKGDTVTQIKYIPLLKKFFVKVKPDSVIIHDIDTLKIVKKEVVEMKWYSKLGLILIGCGVMAVLAVLGIFLGKLKFPI